MARSDFYPEIEPARTGMLDLDGTHRMYWEECGNPSGVPVVFLHGGPGAGANPTHRRFFDPVFYRIVIFDQRGSGRSLPLGEIKDNTTPHLVADMERLRAHLGIDKWVVFGGSWGSTLALAYGEKHPARCLALILRGIFLCRKSEIDWFLHGMRSVFPEAWHAFVDLIPKAERSDLLKAYYARLADPDPAIHLPAARAWSIYEGSCSTLLPSPDTVAAFGKDGMALSLARLEAHYFINDIFLPENSLVDNVGRLKDIPTVIVQGRYDMVCPIVSADDLVRAWPRGGKGDLSYKIIADAGHSALEPGIRASLIGAMEDAKKRLGGGSGKSKS